MKKDKSIDRRPTGHSIFVTPALGFLRHPLVLTSILLLVTAVTANFLAGFTRAQRRAIEPRQPVSGTPDTNKLSPDAARQIEALIKEKESRTPAEAKIDSQLLYQVKMSRGQNIADGIQKLETGIKVDDKGIVAVDIRASVDDALLETLRKMGASIINSSGEYRTINARIPIGQIESIAAMDKVTFIQPYADANVWRSSASAGQASDVQSVPNNAAIKPAAARTAPGFAQRAERVRQFLDTQVISQGSVVSQGDATHRANDVRNWLQPGPDGTGIKIGVLSNGVTSLAASQALGDLPADVTVLPGQTGTGDEGTAMLEIVHDLVPGAKLYFSTANGGPPQFAQNIRDLRTAGCDIIVDDVFYFVETPFQDGQTVASTTNGGVVIQAVKDVTAGGAMYFSSAGNQGNVDDNTASCYQGDWADGGTIGVVGTNHVHDFGGGAQSDLIATGSGNPINLYWSDPLGGSTNDYDLFVLNNALTTIVASSTNIQNGTQDPEEQASSASNVTNNRVVIVQKAGASARFLHITINANGAGRLGTSTPGTTKGHSMAAAAFSVAATPAAVPFPNPFSTSNVSETFTSDGPRRIFYDGDGTVFTPGNVSSTGGILRQKPDITAADGVAVTGVGGFSNPFFGTSAAAPHAAAIAGLLKSAYPTATNADIRNALTSTALDIEAPGIDRDTGVGIIMAFQSAGVVGPPHALLDKGAVGAIETPGFSDGDGQIEKSERATVSLPQLSNIGTVGATGVSASLSSTTPGVSVLSGGPGSPVSYGNIAAAGTGNAASTYSVQLGPTFSCGGSIDFVLTVQFRDSSVKVETIKFSVSTAAVFNVTTTLDATAPPANPLYTATTGIQTNRVFRNGVASTCAAPKVFPGTSALTGPHYDAYSFTAVSSGCTTITYSGSNNLFGTVYSGTFDPANIGTNYVADSGVSPGSGTSTMSFNAVAGQTYIVVLAEVVVNSAPTYNVRLAGSTLTTCNFTPAAGANFSLGGRVSTANGAGVSGAIVTLTGPGVNQTTRTSSFGYYSFDSVPSGQTYTVTATSRAYTFSSQNVLLNDNFAALNFVAGQ